MEEVKNNNIVSVVVIPRTKDYVRYIINDGTFHVKKYYDLEKFLISLVPSQGKRIKDLLYSFRQFYVLVEEMIVEEFKFDFVKERKDMINKMRKEDLNPDKVVSKLLAFTHDGNTSFTNKMERLSKAVDRNSYKKILGLE